MVGSKGNTTSGFSWADEVEKEEEEAQAQLHRHLKPNPFGFARPREVVLQEKGVDWRKLDQKLHETSNVSYVPKTEKENIPAPTQPVNGKTPCPPSSRGINQKIESSRNCDYRKTAPLGCQTLDIRQGLLVPPLMYPPKNYMAMMNGTQWSYCNSNRAEVNRPDFHNTHIENSIRQNGRPNFTVNKSMHQAIGETPNLRIMRTPSANREREFPNMNSNYVRGHLHQERLMGPPKPLLDRRRVEIPKHDIGQRSAEGEFSALNKSENITVESARRRFDSTEFVVPSAGAVGGANCKKKGMKPAFNNIHSQHGMRG